MRWRHGLLGLLLATAAFAAGLNDAHAARHALVIGVSNYQNLPRLSGPTVDARAVRAKLAAEGYDTRLLLDPSRDQLFKAFAATARSITPGDDVIIYYSGHGVDVNGATMMLGVDAPSPDTISQAFELEAAAVAMRPIMLSLEDHDPKVQGWILDACRDNPYAAKVKSAGAQGGLSEMSDNPSSSFIIYAADFARTSQDAPAKGQSSPFTRVFLDIFDANKTKNVVEYVQNIRRPLRELVAPREQFPEVSDKLWDPWCFAVCAVGLQGVKLAAVNTVLTETGRYGAGRGGAPKTVVVNLPVSAEPDMLRNNRPVVYLGKESARRKGCKDDAVSDVFPFGCPLLKELSDAFAADDGMAALFTQALVAKTDVVVRSHLPELGEAGARYACRVAKIRAGDSVQLTTAVALNYLDDTFYYGILEEGPSRCLT